jgi:hypothetical protein
MHRTCRALRGPSWRRLRTLGAGTVRSLARTRLLAITIRNELHAQRDFHASPPDAPQHPANTRLGGRDSPRSPQQGRRRPHGAFRCDCFISSGSDSNASPSRPDRVRLLERAAIQILKPNTLPLCAQNHTRALFGASRTGCTRNMLRLPRCMRDAPCLRSRHGTWT